MAIDLTSNIVSWWRLNEISGTTVADSQGNNDGTTIDNISTITSLNAPDGRSRSFDINNDGNKVITVADNSDLTFADASGDLPFSISAWVNFNVVYGITFVSKTGASTGDEYWFRQLENIIAFTIYNDSGESAERTFLSPSYPNPQWRFVTVTYDGRGGLAAAEGIRFYFDGVEVLPLNTSTSSSYNNMDESGSRVVIGGTGSGSWLYDGNIADVMIFNKALTDGEIKYLYNDGFGVV